MNTRIAARGQSDVIDVARLEQFRKKYEKWVSWLSGEDHHAIWKQIASLLWDYVLFLTINDLRKEAAESPVEGVGYNGPVLRLIDAGFVATQTTGVRRLTERQSNDPTKRVISLRGLVDDVETSRELLTREAYLTGLKLPYGTGPANRESERAQARFDTLAETPRTGRSRGDLVSTKWFSRLDSKIKSCGDVCVFTNKFIAHSADPASRSDLSDDQKRVTLRRLAQCHQSLLQVAEFVGCRILQCSPGASLPTPQFDPVQNLDKAWTTTRNSKNGEDKAAELWQRNWELIKEWESEALL